MEVPCCGSLYERDGCDVLVFCHWVTQDRKESDCYPLVDIYIQGSVRERTVRRADAQELGAAHSIASYSTDEPLDRYLLRVLPIKLENITKQQDLGGSMYQTF